MRYRLLFLLIVAALAFGVWAMWIADEGQGLVSRRPPPPDHDQLLAKLAEPTTLSAEDVPLRELLDELAARHDVDIQFDETTLADPDGATGARVTVDVQGVSLISAIRIALRMADPDLRLEVNPDSVLVVHVNCLGRHSENFVGRVYPLGPLMSAPDEIRADTLAALITDATPRHSWLGHGGSAEIHPLPGGLAVAHTLDVHLQIEELLAQLERRLEHPDDLRPVDVSLGINPGNARALAALDRPITVELIDVPLKDVCARLSTILDVPVLLDTAVLDSFLWEPSDPFGPERQVVLPTRSRAEYGPITDWPATVVAEGQRLEEIVRGQPGISADPDMPRVTVAVWDEAIWITTGTFEKYCLKIYPVADLPQDAAGWMGSGYANRCPCYDGLSELIESTVGPAAWLDAGGTGVIEPLGDALVVYQTPRIHGKIERLIGQLRETFDPASRRVSRYPSAAVKRIEDALAKKTNFVAVNAPLDKAAARLGRQHAIHISGNEFVPEGVGHGGDNLVTVRAEGLSLEQTLYRMLDPLDLTFEVSDFGLEITYPEWADTSPETRVYDVRHLVDPDVGIADADKVPELVTSFAPSFAKFSAGGMGNVEFYAGLLVVSQRRDVQQELAALLDSLTHYQQHSESLAVIPVTPSHHAGTDLLCNALSQTVSVEYRDVPVDRVAADLSKRFEVPIEFEGDIGDHLVNVNAHNVSLAAALDLMLRKAELTFTLRFGRIVITTPAWAQIEWAGTDWLTRIYPVRDLLYYPAVPPDTSPGPDFAAPQVDGASRAAVDYDSLMEIFVETVEPSSWQDHGGRGTLDFCEGALVVSQHWRVHQRIERLLAEIRHGLWPNRHSHPGPTLADRLFARRTTLDADGVLLEDFLADVARQEDTVITCRRPGPFFRSTLGQLIWFPAPSEPPGVSSDPFGGSLNYSLDDYLRWLIHRRPEYWAAPSSADGEADPVEFNKIVAQHPWDLWVLRGLAWAAANWQFELRPDEPTVRFHSSDTPLGDALHDLLTPLRRVLCSDGEMVHVYPSDDITRPLITRVYDVRHLAPPVTSTPTERYRRWNMGPSLPVVGDPDAEMPPAVSPVDGARGSDSPYPGYRDFAYFVEQLAEQTRRTASNINTAISYHGLLVVRDDWHVHREIAAMLAKLSEAARDLPPVDRLLNDPRPDDLDRLLEAMSSAEDDRVMAYLEFLFFQVEPQQRLRQAIERCKNADDPERREAGVMYEHMIRFDPAAGAASTEETTR